MVRGVKPSFKTLSWQGDSSVFVKIEKGRDLSNYLHYHPEIELIMLKRSAGTRIIGTSVGHFSDNEVMLLGRNLPHVFLHDEKYLDRNRFPEAEAFVIQFNESFLGKDFLDLPELKGIRRLLALARHGICLTNEGKARIIPLIEQMPFASSFQRIVLLLEILGIMINRPSYQILVDGGITGRDEEERDPRIDKVVSYTSENYNQNIKVREIAEMINLTPESFCRYFKTKTHKTYMEFLIELRIRKACQMILENDKCIKEIGYACGFDSLSNFYYQFKKIMKKSPLEYKYFLHSPKSGPKN